MKFHTKHSLYSFSIPIGCMLLILVPGADSGLKSVDGTYGKTANYIKHISIDYPDFSLRFIAKTPLEASLPETEVSYSFEIVNNIKPQQIVWQKTNYRINSYETFLVGKQKYFIDLKHSDFMYKELADGELIIWTQPQYEQFEHDKTATKIEDIRKLSALDLEHYRLHSKRELSRFLFATYKGYIQALNMAEDDATSFLGNKNQLLQAQQIESLFSRQNPDLDTLRLRDTISSGADAKLYLSASSANRDLLIGVQFTKQQGKWKITNERFMPDNSNGKKWIKHFMQIKQNSALST